ncbi:MAG TPA: hypothetical protein VGP36_10150 [Mycobacteriales bacterium]|nr:hypothetical protein [Mycobacteriales bacterium]
MIRLLRLVSWLVHWGTRTPRRVIGLLAVPVLVGIALAAGPMRDRPQTTPDVLATGPTTAAPTPTGPVPTVLPGTTGPPTHVRPVPVYGLSAEQKAAAVGYVVAANTHDARPGGDKAFTDSYARTRPYVTDAVYRSVTADSRRGDYEWSQWLAGKAIVKVDVLAAGVPDGAPAPTATTAYARVAFRQIVTPTAGAGGPTMTTGALNLLLSRGSDGRWLVSRLLADV